MSSPTEIAETLRNLDAELMRRGAGTSEASQHHHLVGIVYQLAAEVARMDTELQVLMRLLEGKQRHK